MRTRLQAAVNLLAAHFSARPAPAISRRLLDSRQPSSIEVPMRVIGLAVVLTVLVLHIWIASAALHRLGALRRTDYLVP